jgi:thioredoxin reductase (NADPH)
MSAVAVKTARQPKAKVQSAQLDKGQKIHDLIIIGGGPAALTAAIYTARDDIETAIIEKGVIGGIPATIDVIENYPGFPDGIAGLKLADNMQKQAEKFGATIELAEVTGLQPANNCTKVMTTDGIMATKVVLIASGSDNKKLNIPGEKEYFAKGVHYCATCDGPLYRDKKLVVVGGANSAVQEALFLSRYATYIDLLVRSTLKASDILVRQLGQNNKITVHLHTVPDEIIGDNNRVQKVTATHLLDNKKLHIETAGVFVFVGQIPNTAFLAGSGILLDEGGFIQTDDKLQTAIKGVFAAGDVRSGAIAQISCATGDGTAAAFSIREYLHHLPAVNYKNIKA